MPIQPDGLGTTLTFGTSGFTLQLTSITTAPLDGGDPIDLSHLGSTAWKMKHPRTIIDVDQIAFAGHLDPSLVVSAPINTNELVTVTFPDAADLAFYGSLRRLEPGPAVEGEKIEVTGIVQVTNNDGSNGETGPA